MDLRCLHACLPWVQSPAPYKLEQWHTDWESQHSRSGSRRIVSSKCSSATKNSEISVGDTKPCPHKATLVAGQLWIEMKEISQTLLWWPENEDDVIKFMWSRTGQFIWITLLFIYIVKSSSSWGVYCPLISSVQYGFYFPFHFYKNHFHTVGSLPL